VTGGVKNIKPSSKGSFRKFLYKRKGFFIALMVTGCGALLIGQTVPQNFFKKIFSPQKISVAKDSAGSKHNSPRIRVVKKPAAVDVERTSASLSCPINFNSPCSLKLIVRETMWFLVQRLTPVE
jgi:hypothetical protein